MTNSRRNLDIHKCTYVYTIRICPHRYTQQFYYIYLCPLYLKCKTHTRNRTTIQSTPSISGSSSKAFLVASIKISCQMRTGRECKRHYVNNPDRGCIDFNPYICDVAQILHYSLFAINENRLNALQKYVWYAPRQISNIKPTIFRTPIQYYVSKIYPSMINLQMKCK